MDLTLLGTIIALLAFGYTIFIGSRTIPEWLAERRKRSAEKSKQTITSPPDTSLPSADVTSADFTGSVLYRGDQRLTAISCSSDGEYLAFGGFSFRVCVFSLDTNQIEDGEAHAGVVRSVRFERSGHAIASAADDGIVKISYPRSKEVKVVGSHDGPAYSVAFHPAEELIASAGKDGTIRLWDLTRAPIYRFGSGAARQVTHPPAVVLQNEKGAVFAIDFDKAGNTLASCGIDGSVLIWDLRNRSSRVLTGFRDTVFSVCFHPTDDYLAACGAEGVVRIWNLKTNTCRTLLGHSDTARWLAFDSSGRFLVSASKDRTLRVWEFASERCWVLDGHQDYIYSVVFQPDGERMFSVSGDGTVRAWSVPPFRH